MSMGSELGICVGHGRLARPGCRPHPPWASAALLLHVRLAKARNRNGNNLAVVVGENRQSTRLVRKIFRGPSGTSHPAWHWIPSKLTTDWKLTAARGLQGSSSMPNPSTDTWALWASSILRCTLDQVFYHSLSLSRVYKLEIRGFWRQWRGFNLLSNFSKPPDPPQKDT